MLSVIGWGIGIYAALVVAAWAGQGALLYPAPRRSHPPTLEGARLERIASAGRTVYALYVPARDGAPTIVHFHGNGEDLVDQVPLARLFRRSGLGFFAIEYPGYGLARDTATSEAWIYADADAALARLRELGVPAQSTVLQGMSLGTGVAVEMALRGHGSRLVLLAPYTSMVDMARRVAPFLPARWILRDRYDTAAKAPRVDLPTLVIHGTRDEVIPVEMGKRVSALLPSSRLVLVEGGGHNDLWSLHQGRVAAEIIGFSRGRDR